MNRLAALTTGRTFLPLFLIYPILAIGFLSAYPSDSEAKHNQKQKATADSRLGIRSTVIHLPTTPDRITSVHGAAVTNMTDGNTSVNLIHRDIKASVYRRDTKENAYRKGTRANASGRDIKSTDIRGDATSSFAGDDPPRPRRETPTPEDPRRYGNGPRPPNHGPSLSRLAVSAR